MQRCGDRSAAGSEAVRCDLELLVRRGMAQAFDELIGRRLIALAHGDVQDQLRVPFNCDKRVAISKVLIVGGSEPFLLLADERPKFIAFHVANWHVYDFLGHYLLGLLAKGPGFDTSSLLSFAIAPLENGYSRADASRLVRRLDQQVRALPAARSSAAARFAFLNGGAWSNHATIQTDHRIVSDRIVNFNAVSPGFFTTLGVRVLAGRDFDQSDSRPAGEIGPRSAIVNQAFVKRYLAGRDPIGVRIARGGGSDIKPDTPIVGVVADMSYRGLRDNSEQVFFPLFENDDTGATFYIKVRGAPQQAIPSIRRLVHQDDPRLPILWFRTLDDQVNRSLSTERLLAALSGSFGALALRLSLIGLYGVMSFVVTRRTGTIAAAAAVLAAGSVAAALIPAWRASNVSPTDALRLE
jgi:hypothetical protein